MIVVTGATGHLGQHVIRQLLEKVPSASIAAVVRKADKAADLAARGVDVRVADYGQPAALEKALAGADKVLLISGSEVGHRVAQHQAVLDAAKKAGVKHLVYTSILHAESTTMKLAAEHQVTEKSIRSSGLPFTFLRNGWYTENYTEHLAAALAQNAIFGATKGVEPLAQRCGSRRMLAFELARKTREHALGADGVAALVGGGDRPAGGALGGFGEVVLDVAALVDLAALHQSAPLVRALLPSMTKSSAPAGEAKPRASRSASKPRHAVVFSVAPSYNPRMCFCPSTSMPGATSTRCSPTWMPSIITTHAVSLLRSRPIISSSVCRVAATKRWLTALLLVPREASPGGAGSRERA